MDQKVSEHYQGTRGERYLQERQRDVAHAGFALNYGRFRPYLKPSDVILDFGCGNGGMIRAMKEHYARVDGLEVNPKSAALARESGARIMGSLSELPADQSYDAVVSNHVLEHVRDVCGTLEALRPSIRPGGLFIASLPIDDFRSRHQRRFSREDIDRHLQTWTPRLFANVLFESGFEVVDVHVINWAWHPKLFPFMKVGLGMAAFRAAAILLKSRGLLGVGRVPSVS
jgi:2-polyprenyl-3-methyl-5-hydroxy-6-metoxy-1,4-benzoquinol methylase